MDWIQILDPTDPKYPLDIELPDPAPSLLSLSPHAVLLAVGHGLAGIHRYCHHTITPYTVAAHSLALGLWSVRGFFAAAKCKDPRIGSLYHVHAQEALAHLVHDAAEALGLSDPTAPIKRMIASEGLEQYERRATHAVMGVLCHKFDPRPEDHGAAQIVLDLAALFERVKRADTRILLDEYGAFVRYSARKRDALAGVAPLGIPQGPLRALAGLSSRAQTLLFTALGLTLARIVNLGDASDEPFLPMLAKQIDDVRHWRGIGTHGDAALALILAESILTDDSSPQDYDVPQPCSFPPITFHLRAEGDALDRFAAALADRDAGTERAADRLASQAVRYGFEFHTHPPSSDDDKHGWRVEVVNHRGERTAFARVKGTKDAPARWGCSNKTDQEAVAQIFAAQTPDHFRAMIGRAHPLSYEQAIALRLARLLSAPTVQDGQDDDQRAAAVEARAEKIHEALGLSQVSYGASVALSALTHEQAQERTSNLPGSILLYFDPASEAWRARAIPDRLAPEGIETTQSPAELAALLLDAEWQIPPIAFGLDE